LFLRLGWIIDLNRYCSSGSTSDASFRTLYSAPGSHFAAQPGLLLAGSVAYSLLP